MHGKIGWWRRTPEEGKYKVQVLYHGRAIRWERQLARFEDWQEYTPDDEDWDRLESDINDRIKRGLMEKFWLDLVKKRGLK